MIDAVQVHDISRNAAQTFFETEWREVNRALFGEPFLLTMQGEYNLGATRGQGELLGVARYSVAEGVGYLRELVVKEEHRGQGVGGELLTRFEEECRRRGCHKLFLDVAAINTRAQAFYQRNGWEREGVMRRHWRQVDFENWVKWL